MTPTAARRNATARVDLTGAHRHIVTYHGDTRGTAAVTCPRCGHVASVPVQPSRAPGQPWRSPRVPLITAVARHLTEAH